MRDSVTGLWKRGAFQYGGWLDPLSLTDDPGKATTNSTYVADAYLVHVTQLVSRMAELLGYTADTTYYKGQAATPKGSFNDAWIDAEKGTVWNAT